MATLPNLDGLVRQGDSLLDPARLVTTLPLACPRAAARAIAELRREFVGAVGENKRIVAPQTASDRTGRHAGVPGWSSRASRGHRCRVLGVARTPALSSAAGTGLIERPESDSASRGIGPSDSAGLRRRVTEEGRSALVSV